MSLKILKTLLGDKPKGLLSIPYAFAGPRPSKEAAAVIWPQLPIPEGRLLLVIVIPNGIDPVAGESDNTHAAASEVHAIASRDDQVLNEFNRMAELHRAKQRARIVQLSRDMLRSNSAREQVFALKSLGGRGPVADSAALLQEYMKDPPRGAKVSVAVESLGELCRRVDVAGKERVDVELALARQMLDKRIKVRAAAVREFNRCIQDRPRSREFDPLKADLVAALKPLADQQDGAGLQEPARNIVRWLESPAASANEATTTPASLPALSSGTRIGREQEEVAWRFDAYRTLRYRVDIVAGGGETLNCILEMKPGEKGSIRIIVQPDGYKYSAPAAGRDGLFSNVKKGQVVAATAGPVGLTVSEAMPGMSRMLDAFALPAVRRDAKKGDKTEVVRRTKSEGVVLEEIGEEVVVMSLTKDAIRIAQTVRICC